MAEKLVPTVRTTPTMFEFSQAAIATCEGMSEEAVGVLWAQFAAETGRGRYCWNWNLGNVKKVRGDGHDYVSLKGVWEGVTPAEAQRLIASGQWAEDPSADHAKAVGPGRVSIIALGNNPATWFRAFSSLAEGMAHQVAFLQGKRWLPAWEALLAGDAALFSKRLRAAGYYTASEAAYTNKLRPLAAEYVNSTDWEKAIALAKDEGTPEWETAQPIVHPRIEFYRPTYDDDGEGIA